jgi:hypothetical protein
MPKVTGVHKISIEHGSTGPVDPGARKPGPKHSWPDRVDPSMERNNRQQLKAGVSSTGTTNHNPGVKPH